MTIKYLVGYEENPDMVVATRADAEEYIFSLAEENAYEAYADEIIYCDTTTEDWFDTWREQMEEVNSYRRKKYNTIGKPYQTLRGFILSYYGEFFTIDEVGVLD